jgi:excisionase family DNA binding protein
VTASTAQNRGGTGLPQSHISESDCCDTLLTVAEVAELLRVPVSWVYERTRRRGIDRLPHLKIGKYLRFSHQEVANWLQRMRGI